MTESEAIDRLKAMHFMCNDYDSCKYGHDCTVGCLDTLGMAIHALNKQIPKKPVCIEDKMWCCPVCDNHLLPKWVKYPTDLMPKTEGLPHCMSCGQKIDWSE